MNLNPNNYRAVYTPVMKYVMLKRKSFHFFFYILWLLGAIVPQASLVKCECNYFCANMRIWIDLGENYCAKFGLLIYYPKIVDF